MSDETKAVEPTITETQPVAETKPEPTKAEPAAKPETPEVRHFDPKPMQEQLDRLESKFSREELAEFFKERYGDTNQDLLKRLQALEIDKTRANIALEYNLTAEQVKLLPGKTPEEIAESAKAVMALVEQRKPAGSETQQATPQIPRRIQERGDVPDVDTALSNFSKGFRPVKVEGR